MTTSAHANLPPALANLGQERLTELRDKWSDQKLSQQATEELVNLLALSDFVFQNAIRYEVVFTALTNQDNGELTLTVPDFPLTQDEYLQLDEMALSQALRCYRQYLMSMLAARHFLGRDSIEKTMPALSLSADLFFGIARKWVKEQLRPRWGSPCNEAGDEIELIAMGMGKLGGLELNFSSDIDLIFCYSAKGSTQGGRKSEDHQIYFTKMAQKIIQLLDNVTADGRVFRVDMRLRPFGDSGPLVSSFDAIEDYYQDQGREWERYALLKARALGLRGHLSQAEIDDHIRLRLTLKPFIYRRYIDFSVIESLRTMKRLIQQEVKRRQLSNNIKLGEGGIREVEFIVQAMQMLRGGKDRQLQTSRLLKVVPELVNLSILTDIEADELTHSYLWLRDCEQYLQAFADQQTQTLPDDELNQLRLCFLYQQDSWQDFLVLNQSTQAKVNELFKDVIGEEPEQTESQTDETFSKWQAVWISNEQDESDAGQLVSQLKPDLIKAVSGSRGREKLDALMPLLLCETETQQLSESKLKEILQLIKKIASRTTYLELLVENQGARKQLVKLVSSSHFIGQQISRFPLLLDQLIDPKLLYSVPEVTSYQDELRRNLLRVEPDDLELQMDVLRQFKLANQLVIAACDVEQVASLMQVSDHLTALAEACLEHSVNLAWHQMVSRYGYPDGADDENKNFGVIGYGKLGGFELGYGSDLDIVFVHGCNSSKGTNGRKEIDSRQFYIKLVQRVMHIFTTKTLIGELYELDTRLRPSGASGLLAINIETFAEYQEKEAWTWEHQALVRSRFVQGCDKLKSRFNEIRQNILSQTRDSELLQKDISEMRTKMYDNLAKESEGQFDLKQSRGGIADIEFISQFLVLAHSAQYSELTEFPDNVRILERACEQGLVSSQEQTALIDAYLFYRKHYHVASLDGRAKTLALEAVHNHTDSVKSVWSRLGLK